MFCRPPSHRLTLRTRSCSWLYGCLLGLSLQAHAADAVCDSSSLATVLQAPTQPQPAGTQALWTNGQQIFWPGQVHNQGSRWRLLVSRQGQLHVKPGEMASGIDEALTLQALDATAPASLRYAGAGVLLQGPSSTAHPDWQQQAHGSQSLLVREDEQGRVQAVAALQIALALDAVFAPAAESATLGATLQGRGPQASTRFALWAPTARQVQLCLYPDPRSPSTARLELHREATSGVWQLQQPGDARGRYYRFAVTVWVPGHGLVRQLVTDPYSVSLSANSQRSYIADLADTALSPAGWTGTSAPQRVRHPVDMSIYELHVRDFSITDTSVPAAHRGKYLAFTHAQSRGMRHLRGLAQAGLTDVHLLPVFDLATVPEAGCTTPAIRGSGDSEQPQAAAMAEAAKDCFNWGYDPLHFNAPEGSYATDADDGARRITELRRMVLGLHRAGLRVGMDVVYNHTSASGQHPQSVLDRIVPGYYQRLNLKGEVERSTCCDNTATEHRMMDKLMSDSVLLWAQHYRIDSFRFDLMGHQPREAMVRMQQRVQQATGRRIDFLGEGWNFGEIKDGARFVQASQLSLNGTGIGTFNDRMRDAVRGGSASDNAERIRAEQGVVSGLVLHPNEKAPPRESTVLLRANDQVRAGLAGSLRHYRMQSASGQTLALQDIPYGDQPTGYVLEPAEVVNYVENHDNLTLYDSLVFKLPRHTSSAERARVQSLASALVTLSQGVAYFHAGQDILRSKSLDGNSYDSGDWFNRLDWTYREHHFGTGLPPARDNAHLYPLMRELLRDPALRAKPADIAFARDAFRDWLRIRNSTRLLRLTSAQDISQRLRFFNTGPAQNPAVIAGHLNGQGLPDASFAELVYLVNVDTRAHTVQDNALAGTGWQLHPVHRANTAADTRPREQARADAEGRFTVPPRTAVVFVRPLQTGSSR
jgi:pullulanase/glycogen debranching enzyme